MVDGPHHNLWRVPVSEGHEVMINCSDWFCNRVFFLKFFPYKQFSQILMRSIIYFFVAFRVCSYFRSGELGMDICLGKNTVFQYYSINNTTIFNCIILILYSSCKLLYQNSYLESSVIQYISCTSFRVIWKYKFNSLLTVSSFSLGIKLKLILFTRKFIIRQALFVYPSNCVH